MPLMSQSELWTGELDAVIAAPRYHRILFENEAVRVLDTRVAPGQTVPLHTHACPSSNYLVSFSDFVRRDAAGQVPLDSRTITRPSDGASFWSDAMSPHTLENIGASALHVVSVELKHLARTRG